MTEGARDRAFRIRLYLHASTARAFFYLPVLVHYMVTHLEAAGVGRPRAAAMTLLALFSVGLTVAEYPSGVFADWAGRARSLIVGSVLTGVAVLPLAVSGSVLVLAVTQLGIGVAQAFRSGADSALLYSHLDRRGRAERYGAELAALRFCNLAGVAVASAAGGVLYAWRPASVFVLTALVMAVSALALVGLDEDRASSARTGYLEVLRASGRELRRNRAARALVLLGGLGSTCFLFAFWASQSYLVSIGTHPAVMGYAIAAAPVIQALFMPLSAWASVPARRNAAGVRMLCVGLLVALLGVTAATRAGWTALGAGLLIVASSGYVLYRNLLSVRLQALIPDTVRASLASVEALAGSIWYVVFFPLGGWLLDAGGVEWGYAAIAGAVALTVLPPLHLARRRGVWSSGAV